MAVQVVIKNTGTSRRLFIGAVFCAALDFVLFKLAGSRVFSHRLRPQKNGRRKNIIDGKKMPF
jgi:hypothetical protein